MSLASNSRDNQTVVGEVQWCHSMQILVERMMMMTMMMPMVLYGWPATNSFMLVNVCCYNGVIILACCVWWWCIGSVCMSSLVVCGSASDLREMSSWDGKGPASRCKLIHQLQGKLLARNHACVFVCVCVHVCVSSPEELARNDTECVQRKNFKEDCTGLLSRYIWTSGTCHSKHWGFQDSREDWVSQGQTREAHSMKTYKDLDSLGKRQRHWPSAHKNGVGMKSNVCSWRLVESRSRCHLLCLSVCLFMCMCSSMYV